MQKVLLHLLLSVIATQIMAKKGLIVDKVTTCGSSENVPLKINYLDYKYSRGRGFAVSAEIELERDAANDKIKVVLHSQRCTSRETLDSCEQLSPITLPNICQLMEIRGMGLDELQNGIDPPVHCPIKKGIYKINNATINPELFRLFPWGNYYWKFNASAFENNIYITSVCVDFKVINLRN